MDVNIINTVTAKVLGIAGLEKTPWGCVHGCPSLNRTGPFKTNALRNWAMFKHHLHSPATEDKDYTA